MSTRDFRAQQLETSKIIASGNLAAGKPLGLVIYSGSVATNRIGGVSDSAMLTDVGTDVFLFISGSHKSKDAGNFTRTEATLFGGDVVISGTLYAERQVIEVDSVADGDLIVTGNLYVEPDTNSTTSVAFRNAAGVTIFNVDSTNKRVGIGDTSPDALLDIQGASASGVPSLKIDHDGADVIAVYIDSANTTQAVIDVFSAKLTTGELLTLNDNSSNTSTRSVLEVKQNHASATGATAVKIQADSNGPVAALHIDRNAAGTAAADGIKGIYIDLDQTGEITSATANVIGVDVEIETNSAADGTVNAFGQKITMTGDTDGTHSHTGLSINLGDADNNTHIELLSSADTGDKFTIAVGAAGATTMTTVDDDGANAHLILNIDGNLDINQVGSIALDGVGASNVTTNGVLTVSGSTGLNLHSDGGEVDITATKGLIDINAVAGSIDIDAGDNITLDAADDISLTTTSADGLITIHSAHTAGQAILIDANAAAGSILDIDAGIVDADVQGNFTLDAGGVISIDGVGASNVTTNGVLTVSGSTGLNLASDSGEIDLTSRLGNIDINASAGNVTIDSGGTFSVDAVGTSNITTNGILTVSGSTGLNLASDSGEIDLTSRLGNIDINATAGNVTIDSGGTFSIDGVGASNVTTVGALTISGSSALNLKSDGGTIDIETRVGAIDVDSAGALTLDSAASIAIGTNADRPIDIDASTLDIDTSDNITITAGGSGKLVDIDASGVLSLDSATGIDIGKAADKPIDIDATTLSPIFIGPLFNAVR